MKIDQLTANHGGTFVGSMMVMVCQKKSGYVTEKADRWGDVGANLKPIDQETNPIDPLIFGSIHKMS